MAAIDSIAPWANAHVTVVVSDNSTEAMERDRLWEFCAAKPEGAVVYVRPAQPMDMAGHWEWLWRTIEERLGPTHVGYLTDRLVFTTGALSQLMEIGARDPERVISYQHDTVDDAKAPVELVQSQWTGGLLELDARTLLELSSRGQWGNYLPRMLNCIAPASILTAIQRRFGGVFAPSVSPDYCFAYRCLATVDSVLYLDRPCVIEYAVSRSGGISYMRGRPSKDALSFQQSLSVPRFWATPEPAFETVANAMFQEYLMVRDEARDDRFPPVGRGSYLAANALSATRIEEPEWRARTQDLLRRLGWTRLRRARRAAGQALMIAGYFIHHPAALGRSLKRQLWDRPSGAAFSDLLARIGLNPRTRGDLKFASARDAIEHANSHPRRRMPFAWHVHQLSRAGAIMRRVPSPRRDELRQ
jgi:hypothetical protein